MTYTFKEMNTVSFEDALFLSMYFGFDARSAEVFASWFRFSIMDCMTYVQDIRRLHRIEDMLAADFELRREAML